MGATNERHLTGRVEFIKIALMGATMTIAIQNKTIRPAAAEVRDPGRQATRWSQMSNEDLIFALDVLSLHYSPFEVDAANEIERRIMAGTWIDINQPPPTHSEEIPSWLRVWPFRLLWSQRPR